MGNVHDLELAKLRSSVEELAVLNEIATTIDSSMSIDMIVQAIVGGCLRRIPARQGSVYVLSDRPENEDAVFKTFVMQRSPSDREPPFHFGEFLVGWMIKHRSPLIANHLESDCRFKGIRIDDLGLKSLLALPLLVQNKLIGALTLFNKRDTRGFSDSDKRFLGIVSTQTATVIANAQLLEKEQELLTIREEMRLARAIQEDYSRPEEFETTGCTIIGYGSPAMEVGGDFWDVVPINEHKVFVSIGDVSGKGVPAALLASKCVAIVRSQLQTSPDVAMHVLAQHLNRLFAESSRPEQFVTLFLATYDSADHRVQYVNAGHMPPLVLSADGSLETLGTSDLIIGVIPDTKYTPDEMVLNPGDTLLVYTDGVTDTLAPNGDRYGEDRIKALISGRVSSDPRYIRHGLLADLSQFKQDAPQPDDTTFLVVRAK